MTMRNDVSSFNEIAELIFETKTIFVSAKCMTNKFILFELIMKMIKTNTEWINFFLFNSIKKFS